MTTIPPSLLCLYAAKDTLLTELASTSPASIWFGKHSESQRANHLRRPFRTVGIDQYARQLGDLGNPAPVSFLFKLDRQRHRNRNYGVVSRRVLASRAAQNLCEQRSKLGAEHCVDGS